MTDVRQIPLSRGRVALVDGADYERVAAHEWIALFMNGRWYAAQRERAPRREVLLHRFILEAPPRVNVSFVNGDSLDCQRSNLFMRQGGGGRGDDHEGAPRRQYLGVVDIANRTFGARIRDDREFRWLGAFDLERDAALAYNVAARLLRGPDADVNVIPPAVPLDDLMGAVRDLAIMPRVPRVGAAGAVRLVMAAEKCGAFVRLPDRRRHGGAGSVT